MLRRYCFHARTVRMYVNISGSIFIFLPIPSHRYLILLTIVPVIYDSANCVLIRQWQWPPLSFVIGLINQISLLPRSATVIIHRTSFILDYKQTDAAVFDGNHGTLRHIAICLKIFNEGYARLNVWQIKKLFIE